MFLSTAVVSFAQDTYSIVEGAGMLNVTVNRRGNLEGEARVGKEQTC